MYDAVELPELCPNLVHIHVMVSTTLCDRSEGGDERLVAVWHGNNDDCIMTLSPWDREIAPSSFEFGKSQNSFTLAGGGPINRQ